MDNVGAQYLSRRRSALLATGLLAVAGLGPVLGQQVTLSLGSGNTTPGSAVALNLSMTATGGALPTSLQWTMNYATDVTGVTVAMAPNPNWIGVPKAPSCSSVSASSVLCVIFDVTTNVIPNGSVATATFTISGGSVATNVPITLSGLVASDAGGNVIPSSATSGTITLIQPSLITPSGVSCSPTSVNAPGTSACTVTLSGAAPGGGLSVALSSNNANATVPASVTAAAGATTVGFTATVGSVTTNQTATLTATANSTAKTTSLTLVAPAQLTGVSCAPSTLGTAQSSTCTVTLNKAALSNATVGLSSNTGLLTVPVSMTIGTGASSGTFSATAGTIGSNATATVTASLNAQTANATVSLVAAVTPSGVSCNPTSVNAPGTSACTVTLSGAAPGGGLSVALSSNNANATVPASVTVTAGATTAGFTATVGSLTTNQTATITATANGIAKTTSLALVAPAQLTGVSCAPSALGTAQSSTCTVTLNKAALSTATVGLSSNTGLLTVPASMTIGTGASSGTFSATAGTISGNATATVTASLNAQTANATVSLVAAVTPSSVTCNPTSVNAPGTSACTVTLSGAAPGGGLSVALSSNNSNATVPASVTANSGATTVGFTATVGSVTTNQTATITATANGIAKTASLALLAPRRTISGTVGPTAVGSGATVTLGGTESASMTADASGNYTFSAPLNGTYTVAPSKSGFTFTPSSQSVSVNGANITGVNFAAVQTYVAPTVDAQVWKDQTKASSKVISPAFSTSNGNELLLALVAADYKSGANTSVQSVAGAGLTWVLVNRTRAQKGTAEIWRAFATLPVRGASVTATLSQSVTSSMTVMAFAGVDASGTNGSGAIGAVGTGSASAGTPQAALVTTRNNSLVIGVGVDPQRATARTAGAGQYLIHQYLASSGGTYWVQSQSGPAALSGTSITMNDSAPAKDAYNFSISEILGEAVASGTQTSAATVVTSLVVAPQSITQSQVSAAPSPANAITMSSSATGIAGKTCSPGGLVTIFGTGLTGQDPQSATSYPLPTILAGVQVKINGNAVPLVFASTSQVNFQCPLLPQGSPLEITVVTANSVLLPPIQSTMLDAAPDLFIWNGTNTKGINQGVILIASTNELAMPTTAGTASRPAQPGESLIIYATGLGETQPVVPLGTPAPSRPLIPLKNKITVVIGGVEVDPERSVLAPRRVGLDQIDVLLPQGVPGGLAVPLYLQVTIPDGTVVRSNTVTLAIDTSKAP